jgi:hypothetical protein
VEHHAGLFAFGAEDRQQPVAANGGETMSTRCEHLASVMHVNVVPDRKIPGELLKEARVGLLNAAEGLVREDDTESEGVVWGIPFPDLDQVARVEELDQRRQVETRGPASDDCDIEREVRGLQLPSRSRKRCSFPVAVLGSASANSMRRGYL